MGEKKPVTLPPTTYQSAEEWLERHQTEAPRPEDVRVSVTDLEELHMHLEAALAVILRIRRSMP